MPERFTIDVDGDRISANAYAATHPLGLTLLLGHGANAGQDGRFIVDYATDLARRGVFVVTYAFPFAEHGRRRPDTEDVLEASCRAAIVGARQCRPKNSLFVGGKSLGGRVASRVAAAGGDEMVGVRGLVILGYPLHPVGKPAVRRSEHLSRLDLPVLFVQGTRDALGTADELRPHLEGLPKPTELHAVDGADHSFVVSRTEPRAQEKVHARVREELVRWMVLVTGAAATIETRARPRPVAAHRREQLRALHRRTG